MLGFLVAADGALRTGFTTYLMFLRADFFRFTRFLVEAVATVR